MEDSSRTQETIKRIMEGKLNWKVTIIKNQEEAVSLADQKNYPFYILDVNMGKNREQEGLDALEKIKDVDQQVFVSVFSAYPNFRQKAANLNSNWFEEKGSEIEKGVCNIASKMLEYKLKLLGTLKEDITNNKDCEEHQYIFLGLIEDKITNLNEQLESVKTPEEDKITNLNEQLESVKTPEKLYFRDLFSETHPAENININAYEELKSNPIWFAKYQGKYVAFVNGKLVSSNENKQELLDWLIKSEQYKDEKRFFAKVEEEPRIVDEPTPLWLDIA
ncbi:MAG: response regulator [Tatlockia sp.]|nr:response regulator [Tatlockia sp.]